MIREVTNLINSVLNILDPNFLDFILRLLAAVGFSTIIGLERELTGHKGSIKTNVLICLGSCIFCSYESLICDDTRIAANVVTGVGFLCSGFIFKNGLTVSGLGTAATLWCSAGVGILTSGGYLEESLFISILLFVLNLILAKLSFKIKPLKAFDDTKTDMLYTYNIVCLKDKVDDIKKIILDNTSQNSKLSLEALNVKSITEDKVRIVIDLKSDSDKISDIENVLEGINSFKGVLSVGWKQEEN